MKQLIFSIVLIGLTLGLAGCPYQGDYPTDTILRETIDPILIGDWFAENYHEGGDSVVFKVLVFNEKEYLIEMIEEGQKKVLCRAFISKLAGKNILNFHPLHGSDRHFMYFTYRFEAGILYLAPLNDKYFKNEKVYSVKDMRRLIKKYQHEADLFEREHELILSRMKEKSK